MSPNEKERLVALLLDARRWCQGAEARNADGQPVLYTAADATAWDVTGAACHLFGWRRARDFFAQMDRLLHGDASVSAEDPEVAAMVAVQSWNDDPQTTHTELIARLQSLPVRSVPGNGEAQPAGDAVAEGTQR